MIDPLSGLAFRAKSSYLPTEARRKAVDLALGQVTETEKGFRPSVQGSVESVSLKDLKKRKRGK